MMQPTNNHLATPKGITTHPLTEEEFLSQLFWIWLDQSLVVNIVVAVKMSDM